MYTVQYSTVQHKYKIPSDCLSSFLSLSCSLSHVPPVPLLHLFLWSSCSSVTPFCLPIFFLVSCFPDLLLCSSWTPVPPVSLLLFFARHGRVCLLFPCFSSFFLLLIQFSCSSCSLLLLFLCSSWIILLSRSQFLYFYCPLHLQFPCFSCLALFLLSCTLRTLLDLFHAMPVLMLYSFSCAFYYYPCHLIFVYNLPVVTKPLTIRERFILFYTVVLTYSFLCLIKDPGSTEAKSTLK